MTTDIRKEFTNCLDCGSDNSELVTSGRETNFNTTDEIFSVVRCKECGFVYLNPRPHISELPRLYPPELGIYKVEETYDDADKKGLYYRTRYKLIRAALAYELRRLFPTQESIKMLDVGCSDGHGLNNFKKAGTHQIETYGLEMNIEAAEKAQSGGHKIFVGRFEDVELPDEFFDFVYACHVIEHVPDPKAFARKAWKILRPGGVFGFWTPNIDSLDAQIFQNEHWGFYCFPRHWAFFGPRSVARLANATGFELQNISYAPFAFSWLLTFRSILLANPATAGFADRIFPLEGCIRPTALNFIRNNFLLALDIVVLLLTGRTSNMWVVFRKPLQAEAGNCRH